MDNFDPYNVFLAIATNIPQRLKTVLCSRVTNVSWAANQHIIMISEGSCDTENWSNDAENWALITEIHYIFTIY